MKTNIETRFAEILRTFTFLLRSKCNSFSFLRYFLIQHVRYLCYIIGLKLMAELHVLGHIFGVSQFSEYPSLFCRYSFQSGPNWTSISGFPEGQTLCGSSQNGDIFWEHPLDLHYVTKGIQGWPKLLLQVLQLDSLSRCWLVGYGCCSIPITPGHHQIEVPCWLPAPDTITDKVRQFFLGGSHQLLKPDVFLLGSDRHKLKTESKGNVVLKLDIILRNFKQFGVEYK